MVVSESIGDAISISVEANPGYTHAEGLTKESAAKTSELLNLNHELYHARFNGGFHNHITHHILALWSLGASIHELQDMWEYNKTYQAPRQEKPARDNDPPFLDLYDKSTFHKCLGKNDCYQDFLLYFHNEIARKGPHAVIKEYVLKGDDRANDIFCRMFTDLVHPIIHLGYAIEYGQSGVLAEALAGACVHDEWPKNFLLQTEEMARSNSGDISQTLLQILHDLHDDPVIRSAVQPEDPFNKIRDGLLSRVGAEELAPHLSKFKIDAFQPGDLDRKFEDMMYTNAYALGAAQNPDKVEKMDFVLLHNVTLSVFFPSILAQSWLTPEEKARLVEFTARMSAVMYAACGSPALFPERVVNYTPRYPEHDWPAIFHRAIIHRDEGHVAKLIRSLYGLESLSKPGLGIPIAKLDFIKIAHMAVDSAENSFKPGGCKMPEQVKQATRIAVGQGGEWVVDNHMRFVFYGGVQGAWKWVPDRMECSK